MEALFIAYAWNTDDDLHLKAGVQARTMVLGTASTKIAVTGSAHCTLIPYWAKKLGKKKLAARRIAKRVGELWCEDSGDRVEIARRRAPFMEGTIRL